MKIIHCLNQYMPMAMAGTEVYTHTLATMQKKSGNDVAVVTPHIDYYRPGNINEHYEYEGIDVYQFLEEGDPTNRQIHYGNKKPSGLENFKSLIDSLNPGVINFHELNRSIGFTTEHVKIAKQSGAKVFLTIHLSSYTCNTNILVRNGKLCDGKIREQTCTICSYKTLFNIPSMMAAPLANLAILSGNLGITKRLRAGRVTTSMNVPLVIKRIKSDLKILDENVDQFISYAKWYKKILLDNGIPQNKITVVPAALVTEKETTIRTTKVAEGLPLRLVFIGRIQPTKGIHLIIDALKDFSPDEIQMDIYGKAEDTEYYKKCISDTVDSKCIHWKGFIKREDVVDCLAEYHLFCLASTFSEMSPLVIQEAFAAGIPVLASKVYGNMEQIEDGINGLLFEFNSVNSLQKKIKAVISNLALIHQLKKNIKPPVTFNVVNDMYLKLYVSEKN